MYLTELDYSFMWYVLPTAIAIGVILFFLTGFIHIKKNYTGIIEKLDEFYGIYESGYHYFKPFVYRRVGMYKNTPREFEIMICGVNIKFKIQIKDFKIYHYSGKYFDDLVDKLKVEEYANVEEFINILQCELTKIGCSLVK